MIGPQEVSTAIAQLPGVAKAIETSAILMTVAIGAVLIFQIIKLVLAQRDRGRREPEAAAANPGPAIVVAGNPDSGRRVGSCLESIAVQGALRDSALAAATVARVELKTDAMIQALAVSVTRTGDLLEEAKGQTRLLREISDALNPGGGG